MGNGFFFLTQCWELRFSLHHYWVKSTSDSPFPGFTYLLNFLSFYRWNYRSCPLLLPPKKLKVKINQPAPMMTEKSNCNAGTREDMYFEVESDLGPLPFKLPHDPLESFYRSSSNSLSHQLSLLQNNVFRCQLAFTSIFLFCFIITISITTPVRFLLHLFIYKAFFLY